MPSVGRYRLMIFLQFFLLIADILINSFSDFCRHNTVVLLILFIIQDVSLIFSLIAFFINFFSTLVFQAGFLGFIFRRFRVTIVVCGLYVTLTIGLHMWLITSQWYHQTLLNLPGELLALYFSQRILAVFYYYFYKRTVLRIGDPRFYEDFDIDAYEAK